MRAATLYLVRHAQADERGPAYPDDRLRPLVKKGERQAVALTQFLTTQGVRFDRLFSSPYTRAAQTAERLSERLKPGRGVQYLDTLAGSDYPQLLTDIGERLGGADTLIALVGHEPYLGELAAWLLTGRETGARLHVRKACLLTFSGDLGAGQMQLEAMIPAKVYKA